MLDKHTQRSHFHLIRQIEMRSHDTPNFCLLIGSGASYSSGIITAKEMMQEWAHLLFEQEPREEPFDQWEKEQEWFEDEDKYSILFEKAYDQKPQRRNYIE